MFFKQELRCLNFFCSEKKVGRENMNFPDLLVDYRMILTDESEIFVCCITS